MEFLFAESFYMYINGFFVWFDNKYVRTFWVKTKPLIKIHCTWNCFKCFSRKTPVFENIFISCNIWRMSYLSDQMGKYNASEVVLNVMQEKRQSLRTTSFHAKYDEQPQLNIKLDNQKGNRWMYCSGFKSFHCDKKEDGNNGTTIYDDIQCNISVNPYKHIGTILTNRHIQFQVIDLTMQCT